MRILRVDSADTSLGSLLPPFRWLLHLGGVDGNKKRVWRTFRFDVATHGRYFAPFARILLAIAYVRDKDRARHAKSLASLHDDFR